MGPCFRRDDIEFVVAPRLLRGRRMTGQSIDTARRALTARFKSAAIESAEIDARLLVGAVLGLDLTGMIAAVNRTLTPDESSRLDVFARRRLASEPVAS